MSSVMEARIALFLLYGSLRPDRRAMRVDRGGGGGGGPSGGLAPQTPQSILEKMKRGGALSACEFVPDVKKSRLA